MAHGGHAKMLEKHVASIIAMSYDIIGYRKIELMH